MRGVLNSLYFLMFAAIAMVSAAMAEGSEKKDLLKLCEALSPQVQSGGSEIGGLRLDGTWTDADGKSPLDHTMVIERVTGNKVTLLYANGEQPAWYVKPECTRHHGTYDESSQTITFQIQRRNDRVVVTYALSADAADAKGTYVIIGGKWPGKFPGTFMRSKYGQ